MPTFGDGAVRQRIEEYLAANPDASTAEVAEFAGTHPNYVSKVRSRARKREAAEAIADIAVSAPQPSSQQSTSKVAGTGSARTPAAGTSKLQRKAKKRKRFSEPDQKAVDSLYNLTIMVSGVGMAMFPERYWLTSTDQESILRPLCRMYLRRREIPAVDPDTQDKLLVAIGVGAYVSRITAGFTGLGRSGPRSAPAAAGPAAAGQAGGRAGGRNGHGAGPNGHAYKSPSDIMAEFADTAGVGAYDGEDGEAA